MRCSQEPAGRTQQVCSAGPLLLGLVPPPPLPCCVVLSVCSQPTYLCHQQPLLSLPGWAEVRNTWKKGLENKCKDHSALGEPALSPGTKPTLGRRGFCLLPAHQLSSKVKNYTNMCLPIASTNPDNHDDVISHLKPDILECEVKWALERITINKASGGDGIPMELFQILKDDVVKVLHSICQQIWKTQQWPQDWKRSVFIPIPKKGNAKGRLHSSHTLGK